MQNGMDALGADERNAYVSDFKGFVTYVRDKGFQTYADKVSFVLFGHTARCHRLCTYRPWHGFEKCTRL